MLSSSKVLTMNTFKAELNKIILALTSLGIVILLMLPASLSADHYRYGTMSWEIISDNGTHKTIRLIMQNGWTADHWAFNNTDDDGNNLVIQVIQNYMQKEALEIN